MTQIFVWGLLFSILFLLRSFFLLIFLTFVFSYILTHLTEFLAPRFHNRVVRVIVSASAVLLVLIGTAAFIIPKVKDQAATFSAQYPKYLANLDHQLVNLLDIYPGLEDLLPAVASFRDHPGEWSLRISPSASLLQKIIEADDDNPPDEETSSGVKLRETIKAVASIGGKVVAISSSFLLSLLFSFLIVLDLPNLTRSVVELKDTKLAFIYHEVAGSLRDFGATLGRALQAQLFIAILNTILTSVGMTLLGLDKNVAFLSMIVFLGSFVPVAGVFMSSIPICLVTLQESGLNMTLATILLITSIHMLETYVLNPRIYGRHLHMNPVLVLGILVLGGKLFGVWGLVLGVPVCRYIFGHAIRRERALPAPATL